MITTISATWSLLVSWKLTIMQFILCLSVYWLYASIKDNDHIQKRTISNDWWPVNTGIWQKRYKAMPWHRDPREDEFVRKKKRITWISQSNEIFRIHTENLTIKQSQNVGDEEGWRKVDTFEISMKSQKKWPQSWLTWFALSFHVNRLDDLGRGKIG